MCHRSPALSLLAIVILTPQMNCGGISKSEETSTTSDASSFSVSNSETSFTTSSTGHVTSPTSIDTLSTDTNNVHESASSTANTTSDSSGSDCSLARQDCPDGNKCSAFGESYDQARCVPVSGDRKPGEECTVVPGYTGEDDCETGAVCLRLDLVGPAVCFDMCKAVDPLCENGENFDCFQGVVGIVDVCVPSCDPLGNDCDTDFICVPEGQIFWCIPAVGNVPLFGACPNGNECGAGLFCASPIGAMECDPDVSGCCLPFCDLNGTEDACPGMGQVCVSIYPPDDIPSKYSHVGICTI